MLLLAFHGVSHAAQSRTPLAVTAASGKAEAVVACLAQRIPMLVAPDRLSTGMEARVELHPAAAGGQFSVTLLLKPDVYALLDNLDEDHEAHPVLQAALLNNLRHHIATRIYAWGKHQDCRAAAEWLTGMTQISIDLSPRQ